METPGKSPKKAKAPQESAEDNNLSAPQADAKAKSKVQDDDDDDFDMPLDDVGGFDSFNSFDDDDDDDF